MKTIGKKSISNIMKYSMFVCMAVTVIAIITLPLIVDWYIGPQSNQRVKNILLITLYPCGVCGLIVENELRKMFNSLVNKDPFVEQNVKSFRVMGYTMCVMVAIFLFKSITLNTIMTMFICFASAVLVVFCFVLADVFKQAVLYKQDIDLTV